MKLEPGKPNYPLDDVGKIHGVYVDCGRREMNGALYPLQPISPAEYDSMVESVQKKGADIVGIPTYFAYIGPEIGICLFPAPEKDWELHVDYYPAMRRA